MGAIFFGGGGGGGKQGEALIVFYFSVIKGDQFSFIFVEDLHSRIFSVIYQ